MCVLIILITLVYFNVTAVIKIIHFCQSLIEKINSKLDSETKKLLSLNNNGDIKYQINFKDYIKEILNSMQYTKDI